MALISWKAFHVGEGSAWDLLLQADSTRSSQEDLGRAFGGMSMRQGSREALFS